MKIEFTNEQFRELLYDVALAVFVRESQADEEDEETLKHVQAIEAYLLTFADKFGASDMVEKDEEGDQFVAESVLDQIVEETVQPFLEERFWEGLTVRLAERDLLRIMPAEELEKLIRKSNAPPKQFEDIVNKYADEFDKHGVARLEVKK